jgi:hypothetical protein
MGGLAYILAALIAVGTIAGLIAASRRFHTESANRRVEIALDWQEVWDLAQTDTQHRSVQQILGLFRLQDVTTLVINEDTLSSLEISGALSPQREQSNRGHVVTVVDVDDSATLARIRHAAAAHGWAVPGHDATVEPNAPAGTLFVVQTDRGTALAEASGGAGNATHGARHVPHETAHAPEGTDSGSQAAADDNGEPQPPTGEDPTRLFIAIDYATLRTMGVGLPADAAAAARQAGLRIAGRISNFQGVTPETAERVLKRLTAAGATTVIYAGEEVLGYRGMEKETVPFLSTPTADLRSSRPAGLHYGAVEFGKQKGDEKLQAALKGDFVRVHSIQTGEMGQIDEIEAIDRFVHAARERNIRLCFVRLLTFAGADPIAENLQFVRSIARGIQKGGPLTGGKMAFGTARPFRETGVSKPLFLLLALGAAAGTVWMLRLFLPFPRAVGVVALLLLSAVCVALALLPGDAGRKLVALLAGIVFPTAACLITFPRFPPEADVRSRLQCAAGALRTLAGASLITAIGIVHVVGLLATKPFIAKADQFLGIKAQHAVPILLIGTCAIVGGAAYPGERWRTYRRRAAARLYSFWDEPVRVGILLLALIGLAGLTIVVIRTGNDPGVGVSGFELKARAVLDRILPVRPRTKEFLVGHPAFVLAIAWWLRGRRRLAVPAFVVGSIGQVSLLNTFCHIHTPLIISVWRDGIGLVLGALLGLTLFLIVERLLPSLDAAPPDEAEPPPDGEPDSVPVATQPPPGTAGC